MKIVKKLHLFCVAIGCPAVAFAAVLFFRGHPELILEDVLQKFPGALCMMGMIFCSIIPIGAVGYALFKILFSPAMATWFRLFLNRWTAWMQGKNAGRIYLPLQSFLFQILQCNKKTLHLELGQDESCLTPRGYHPEFRKECVFFRFELVTPEEPDMDLPTLRSVIQQQIWAELLNYGIAGLPAYFRDPVHGILPAVYLDRINYDEKLHLLRFDILYIATPEAAQYAMTAHQRDKTSVKPEPEIFDDDLE